MNTTPRPDLTREEVEDAIKRLHAAGKEPTITLIHSITGGSRTTISRLKREIEADEAPPIDSPQAREACRKFWEEALKVGADLRAKELEELRKDFDETLAENERLEIQNRTAEGRLEKLREQQEEMQSQLAAAQAQATQARANCESDARRLAEALAELNSVRERFASEDARLRGELAGANARVHDVEVRAAGLVAENDHLKARLAAAEERNSRREEQNDRLEAQMQAVTAKLAEAGAANSELSFKLTDAENRASEAQKRYCEELPPLREKLDAAIARCHETEVHLARLQGQFDLETQDPPSSSQTASVNGSEHPGPRCAKKRPAPTQNRNLEG